MLFNHFFAGTGARPYLIHELRLYVAKGKVKMRINESVLMKAALANDACTHS